MVEAFICRPGMFAEACRVAAARYDAIAEVDAVPAPYAATVPAATVRPGKKA